ncbi:MAG: SIR2 family protein [Nitrospinota bacterium]|nr:SIR2 family protein [Nitrospinota bacterium]
MTKRSTIIFGNGLGMALDPEYFPLKAGLNSVWNNTCHLKPEHKSLILSAISGTTKELAPVSEEQLDKLQTAIFSIEFLNSLETNNLSWVSDLARDLPEAFKKYIHEVGLYFHRHNKSLPDTFIDPLSKYIKETKSHVATLNYDNLLYDSLNNSGVLDGYSGTLIDGYWSIGFSEENLIRHNINKHAWYLHLHGSPLFIGNHKAMKDVRNLISADTKNHIILSHVKHKSLLIETSPILSTYWKYLDKALSESSKIILFGYSGLDEHLNERIALSNKTREIIIVEWDGAGEEMERNDFWKITMRSENIIVKRKSNILEFDDWHIEIEVPF